MFSTTLHDNIQYGLLKSEETNESKIKKALTISNGLFALDEERFPEQLNTLVGERGVKLSGGQKQRIAIGIYVIMQLEV